MKGKQDPALSKETISPAVAQEYLQSNLDRNRRLSAAAVTKYKNEIIAGEWDLATPIMFNVDGKLIDGQHRLEAIKQSGKSVDCLIIRNMPLKAEFKLDIGRNRTGSDIANLMGHAHITKHHTAVCSAMFLTRPGIKNRIMPPTLARLTLQHFDAISFALKAQTRYEGQRKIHYAPFMAVAARAYYTQDRQTVQRFLALVSGGPCVEKFKLEKEDTSACMVLRETYLSATSRDSIELFNKAQMALLRFINKQKVHHILGTDKNLFPVESIDTFDLKTYTFDESHS